MARLQRKKTKVKKPKKQNAETATSPGSGDDAVAKATELSTDSDKNAKVRSWVPRQKALTRVEAEPGKLKGYINKGLQFLREVKVELKKVVWPTRRQALGSTAVVLILVMIVSIFLGMVDVGLSSLIRVVLK